MSVIDIPIIYPTQSMLGVLFLLVVLLDIHFSKNVYMYFLNKYMQRKYDKWIKSMSSDELIQASTATYLQMREIHNKNQLEFDFVKQIDIDYIEYKLQIKE